MIHINNIAYRKILRWLESAINCLELYDGIVAAVMPAKFQKDRRVFNPYITASKS